VKKSKRSLPFAVAGVILVALFASVLFLLPRQGPEQSPGPPEKVSIAISTNLNPALVHIAQAKGFFREEGLDATIQLYTFGKAALEALLNGKADFATAADTPIMFAMMKDAKLSILATIQTSTKNEAVVARKDRGITSAADLKGRRVGVSLGTSGDYFFDSYLVLEGLARKDVDIIDLNPEEMTDSLVQGKVDAVATWNPLVTNLGTVLGDNGITLRNQSAYTGTFIIVSSQGFPEQRPEAVRRLLLALAKAESFVAASPVEAKQIMSEFCGMDRELLSDIWNDFQFNLSLNQSLLFTLEDQARWAVKTGLTDRRDTLSFLESFYFDGLRSVKPESVRIIR
jgi:NitT/TauT family transport system substrate-binding protein